jgi:putative oxidoreductase
MSDSIATQRPFIPVLSGFYRRLVPYSYPLMRFSVGAILMPHGYSKLFTGGVAGTAVGIAKLGLPAPLAWAYLVGAVEFFAALLLAIGLLTRPAALLILIEMAVITFFIQFPNGYFWTKMGYEYALLLGLLSLGFCLGGGGPLSVDRAIGKEF